LAKVVVQTSCNNTEQSCQKSYQCKEFDRYDRNALFTIENYGGYNNRFFLAVFRLAEFFSGGFSVNAENIHLGG